MPYYLHFYVIIIYTLLPNAIVWTNYILLTLNDVEAACTILLNKMKSDTYRICMYYRVMRLIGINVFDGKFLCVL